MEPPLKTDVQKAVRQCADMVLQSHPFSNSKAAAWCQEIGFLSLDHLSKKYPNLKWTVSTVILEKLKGNMPGFYYSTSCVWDDTTDGHCEVKHETATMIAFSTVAWFRV
mmetsp:Transcript_44787/g.112908  ORF Transcript_44787/g.112908 Transcript_44787/m.112908 type:complete len:109 (+) Transcript_44787:318-644(+)